MIPALQFLYSVLFATALVAVQLMGFVLAAHAIMTNRTTQGTIAWALMLSVFPYLGVPLYLFFGVNRFEAYIRARRKVSAELQQLFNPPLSLSHRLSEYSLMDRMDRETIENLALFPFTPGNNVELLINGEETFASIFKGIEEAHNYILVQFFAVESDELGQKLKDRLIARARDGVDVYFLYDAIGSRRLNRRYLEDLRKNGVKANPFRTGRGWRGRLRLNFRNHRKIVITDGEKAWIGGHNVSNTYLGKNPNFGHWRDTHLFLKGPAVTAAQITFCEDWYWETRTLPPVAWPTEASPESGIEALVLATGPADMQETCSLSYLQMIQMARKRIWIHSPYFVPEEKVVSALQLAALRGIDVRILLPEKPDHWLVWLSSFYYVGLPQLKDVKIHRYQPGFLHSKAMLVDDFLASIGTINFDNRSFRINFEITTLVCNRGFAAKVETMMEEDFRLSRLVHPQEYESRSLLFRVAVRSARLLSPLQ